MDSITISLFPLVHDVPDEEGHSMDRPLSKSEVTGFKSNKLLFHFKLNISSFVVVCHNCNQLLEISFNIFQGPHVKRDVCI